jgi:hypothetical protein
MFLKIEYFETDQSSYKHRLCLRLKAPKSFRVADGSILEVEHFDGSIRNVPLLNVKQYFETGDSDDANA